MYVGMCVMCLESVRGGGEVKSTVHELLCVRHVEQLQLRLRKSVCSEIASAFRQQQ